MNIVTAYCVIGLLLCFFNRYFLYVSSLEVQHD